MKTQLFDKKALATAVILVLSATALAQFRRGVRPRRADSNRSDYPQWTIPKGFEQDVFTFVRIRYGAGGRGGWRNDYPDCDWNFSYRLQQLTSMEVDPNGRVMTLDDPELTNYPWIYMSNVDGMYLSPDEVAGMKHYLLNGGFLMADDFWTPRAWRSVVKEMEKVFPHRKPRELTIDHEIFNLVYDIPELPRVPSMIAWQQGYMFEPWHGDSEGDEAPHFQGYFDDNGRLMALFCHNNDIGDGWEREGENHEFFEKFSVRLSYPLGINIVTYAMTH